MRMTLPKRRYSSRSRILSRTILFAVLVAGVLPATLAGIRPAARPPASPSASLAMYVPGGAQATQITAHDRKFWKGAQQIKLRGINIQPTWDGRFPTDADFARIASWGMNFVRLQVRWSFIEPLPPVPLGQNWIHTYSTTYINYLKAMVGYGYNHGVHVLIDNAGKPGPSVLDDWWPQWLYLPLYNSHGKIYLTPDAANTDYWTDALQQRFTKDFLSYLALQLATTPGIVGYEVLNEPQRGTLLNTNETTQTMLRVSLMLGQGVRVADPPRVVFFMTRGCCGEGLPNADLSGFTTLGNVALDVHDYYGGRWGDGLLMDPTAPNYGEVLQQVDRFTLNTGPYLGTTTSQTRIIANYRKFVDPRGIPLVMGEFSGDAPDEQNTASLMGSMTAAFNERDVAWTLYGYTGRFGILQVDGTLQPWAYIVIDAAKAP